MASLLFGKGASFFELSGCATSLAFLVLATRFEPLAALAATTTEVEIDLPEFLDVALTA